MSTAGPWGPTAGPDLTAADPAAPVSDLHVGRLLFTPELLIRFTRGRFEVIGDALPDDARWCSIAYDYERAAVSLVVEHPTFPASAPGDVIPILPAPIIRASDAPGAPRAPTDAMIDAALEVIYAYAPAPGDSLQRTRAVVERALRAALAARDGPA